MAKKVTKKDCIGCRNDFYNYDGRSSSGRCWSMDSATFEKAMDIPSSLPPPYRIRLTSRPSCYHRIGFIRVKKESLTEFGYWKGITL